MNHITVPEFIERREQAKREIADAVSTTLAKFKADTGVCITSVDVTIFCYSEASRGMRSIDDSHVENVTIHTGL